MFWMEARAVERRAIVEKGRRACPQAIQQYGARVKRTKEKHPNYLNEKLTYYYFHNRGYKTRKTFLTSFPNEMADED